MLASVLIIAMLLSGCGSKHASAPAYWYADETAAAEEYAFDDYASYDMPEAMPAAPAENAAGGIYEKNDSAVAGNSQTQNSGQKKIYKCYLSIESTDFDGNYNAILAKLDECGGYVSYSNMSGGLYYDGTPRYRSADLELKIPAANYRAFLEAGELFGNIVSRNEQVDDITSQYLDVEARIGSLKAEEQRLLELLKQTGTLEELLAVEERLADVRYEIESYTSTKNTYDSWINYCTVTIDISEVNRTQPAVQTFGQRIIGAFRESWSGAADFFRNLAVGIIYALPAILILAVIAVAVILIVKKTAPKRQMKARVKAEMKAMKEQQDAQEQQADAPQDGQ